MYTKRTNELELGVFLLCLEDPGQTPKMRAYGERCRIPDLGREDLALGPWTKLRTLRTLCGRNIY